MRAVRLVYSALDMYYELPPDDEEPRAGCREVFILTQAAFAVLIPVVLLLIAILALISFTVVLYAENPPLALIPIAIGAIAVAAFVLWERRRYPPPDL